MRSLSGIQPTGRLHFGNYFGMIRPAVEMQSQGEAYYFLADYHALTGAAEPGKLAGLVNETYLDLLRETETVAGDQSPERFGLAD